MTFPHHPEAAIPDHVQALIFDCDGTLVDAVPIHFAAWTKALEPYGITMGEKRFYQYAGMPTAKIIEILSREQGIAVSPSGWPEEGEVYLEFLHRAAPIDDVIAIARREQGHRKLAVASGGWRRIVEAALNVVGVLDLFPVIVGARPTLNTASRIPMYFWRLPGGWVLRRNIALSTRMGNSGFEATAGRDAGD